MPITYYPTFKNSSGNVGIGTISPGFRFDIKATTANSTTTFALRNSNDSYNFIVNDGGTASAGADFRAPIFYDSNNTAYYLDAANSGTSLLVAGNVGVGVTSPNGRLTVLGDGSSNNFSGVLRVADSASAKWGAITLPDAQGTTTSANNFYLIGRGGAYTDRVMSFHIPNATDYGFGIQPKFAVYSTGSDLLFSTEATTGTAYFKGSVGIGTSGPSALLQVSTGTPTASTSGIQFGDDTSARIFRSSSAVIRVTGSFEAGNGYVYASNYLQTGNNLIYPSGYGATQRLEVSNSANNAWITGISIAPGGIVSIFGDIRAPIFYDSNDTNYYGDFASTSRLNILNLVGYGYINGQTLNSQSFYQWEGATFRNPGDHTPQLLIRKDNSTTGINGFAPALALYNNNGSDQTTVGMAFVSAEAASPTQGNAVELAGIIAKKESSGTAGGWSQGSLNFFVKDFGTRRDVMSMSSSGVVTAFIDIRSPIFYDSGNTAFYVDPASTSVLNALTVGGNNVLTTASTLTAGNLSGTIPSTVLGNSTVNIGTTAIALNRGSASQTLTGVSIDGNAATVTNGVYTTGNQSIAGNKTFTGITSFTNASDYQISLNGSGTTWAGIEWIDSNGTDYMWYNGQNKTFAIGGGGSNISGKKLHVDGGVTIGADYDSTVVPANGLSIQGAIQIGDYYIFPINSLSSSATQARTFEIARIGIDFNDWNGTGTFEVELHEQYYSRGLKKVYNIWYGYVSNSGIRLVEWRGNGDNNFQCRIGSQVLVSGDHYYLPVFVDVRNYGIVDVVVKTNRLITTNTTPAIGYTYVNTAPTPTNITDFTADSDLELSTLGSAKLGGNTILTSNNYSGYSTFSGSVTSTYGNFTTPGLIIGDAQYGFYVVSGNVYYKSASGGVHYWRNIANNADTMSLNNSGTLTLTGDVRAPIFYDSNDTNYYLNPASSSVLNTLTMAGTITGALDATVSFTGGVCTAASYNYILNGANDTGNKLVIFVNGSTRTADGGVNALTIRNDGGAFVLGSASYLTSILGSSVTINGNAALTSASTLTAGNLSGTIPSGVLGNSTVNIGTTAIALNRGSGSQTLTGVSIDGNAANVTGTVAVANGGTGATTAANARTNLGATTVGGNLFTLTNPSAITFIRVNADNTVSALDAATFRTAIGAGTGSVTSVGGTGTVSGLTLTGTVTTTGNLTLGGTLSVTASNFASQTANTFLAAPNGTAGVPTFRTIVAADIPTLNQNTTGTASNITAFTINQNLGTANSPTFADLFTTGNIQIRNTIPSITFRDTDHRTGYIHVNSNIFYILGGPADSAYGAWNQVANGRWPVEINLSNNNATFGGDVNAISLTAPIFYDANNTAYYIDAASTSILNRIDLPSGSATINTTTPGQTVYQLNFTGQGTADNAQAITWGWSTSGAQAGIYVQSSGAYGTKMYIATTDSFATGSKTAITIDHTGIVTTNRNYLQAAGSLRAPIFYDSDNTGYYLDANSITSLRTVGSWRSDSSTWDGEFSGKIQYHANHWYFQAADSWLFRSSGGNNVVSISQTGSVTAAQYYTGGWFRNNSSGNGLYNESTGQHFYSDTANYWNVASSANAQGIRLRTGGYNGTIRGYFYADTANDVGLLNQDGSWRVRVVGGDYLQADGSSIRGQIFYDSNDTNYYVDPASTSILNIVNNRENIPGGSGTGFNWNGTTLTYYWTRIANVGGGDAQATLLITYKTDVNYNPFGLALLSISRFNSSTFSVKLEKLNGDARQLLVRVDNNNDVWLYTEVEWSSYKTWKVISKLGSPTIYYSSLTEQLTTPANSIEIASGQEVRGTQGAATSATVSIVPNNFFGGLTVRSDVRAPIFYDSANTSYYIDAASTSNLVGLTVANTITGSVSGNAGTATTLQTARNINGTSFNGSANITTATWGTSRNIGIGATIKSVDGSANISWSLAEITGSTTNNVFLAGPNGTVGNPTFRSIVAADIPTLNQNTTGTAGNVTGVVAIANGGTGQTSAQAAINALAGAVSSGQYLRGNGTNVVMSAIQAADVPTLNQNTTGNAGSVTNGVYTNTDQNITGVKTVYVTSNTLINTVSAGNRGLAIYQDTVNTDAYMTFHIGGDWAGYFGLGGIENDLVWGGWSIGNNRYRIMHSGNSANAWAMNQGVATTNTPKFVNVFGERTSVTASASTTVNTQFNVTELTMSASITTLTLSNIQANNIVHMWTIVTLGNGTAYSITWPAAVKWPGGTAPTITSANTKRDIYQFVTYDGGTNIYAIIVGQNL